MIRRGYVVCVLMCLFKQKTAYEMRISDWSSDVCSSDLIGAIGLSGEIGGIPILRISDSGVRITRDRLERLPIEGVEGVEIVLSIDDCSIEGGRSEERRVGKECQYV